MLSQDHLTDDVGQMVLIVGLLLGQFHVRFKTSEEGLVFKINNKVLVGKGNI